MPAGQVAANKTRTNITIEKELQNLYTYYSEIFAF